MRKIILVASNAPPGPVVPPPPPPIFAPSLVAQAVGTAIVNFTGTPPSPPPTPSTFTLQFGTSTSGPFSSITQTSPNFSETGLLPSTQYFGRLNYTTTETPPRTSAWSAFANATTGATPPIQTGIQWYPGDYMGLGLTNDLPTLLGQIDQVASTAQSTGADVTGIYLIQQWNWMEFAEGVYTQGSGLSAQGIAAIQQILAKCASYGFQLILGITSKVFSTSTITTDTATPPYFQTTKDSTGALPLYLVSTNISSTGYLAAMAKNYDSVVTQRRIAWANAYGKAFDGQPFFYGIRDCDETSSGLYNGDQNYNLQVGQMCGVNPTGGAVSPTWGTGYRAAFPTSYISYTTNFMNGTPGVTTTQFQTLFTNSIPQAIGQGGPDSSANLSQPNDMQVFNGYLGGIDYRLRIPFTQELQSIRGDQSVSMLSVTNFYSVNGSLALGGQCFPSHRLWGVFFGSLPVAGTGGATITWNLQNVCQFLATSKPPINTVKPTSYAPIFNYYIGPSGSDSNPGTQASPWALTAINTKQSTYAGKSVGVLPGTYNCLSLVGGSYTGDFSTPAFFIAGGTATSQTVIQSTVALGAILDGGANATNNPNGQPLIGNVGTGCQYITLDGFEIKNCFNRAVSFGVTTEAFGTQPTQLASGLLVQNNYVHTITNTLPAANTTAITVYSSNGAIVQNNYVTDIQDTTVRGDAIEIWTSINSIVQYNTVIAQGVGMYAGIVNKNQWNWNNTIRFNYIDLTLAGTGANQGGIVMDSNGAGSTVDIANNNIVIADYPVGSYLIVTGAFPASVNQQRWFNNTFIGIPNESNVGFYRLGAPGTMTFFNNIFVRGTVGYRGDVDISASAAALMDYNCYPASPKLGLTADGTQNSPVVYNSTSALGAALPSACVGKEAHSIMTNTPGFVMTGTLAAQYQLASGSAAQGKGSTTGTTAGVATDMGAWGNGALRIGCNFTP